MFIGLTHVGVVVAEHQIGLADGTVAVVIRPVGIDELVLVVVDARHGRRRRRALERQVARRRLDRVSGRRHNSGCWRHHAGQRRRMDVVAGGEQLVQRRHDARHHGGRIEPVSGQQVERVERRCRRMLMMLRSGHRRRQVARRRTRAAVVAQDVGDHELGPAGRLRRRWWRRRCRRRAARRRTVDGLFATVGVLLEQFGARLLLLLFLVGDVVVGGQVAGHRHLDRVVIMQFGRREDAAAALSDCC